MFEMLHTSNGNQDLLPSISGATASTRAKRWLADRIKSGAKKEFAEIGVLTPEVAALLLQRNEKNRVVKEATVERYARDIETGRFAFNGEPIIVADTGELNDGQHRCHAVVYAQKPIKTLFVFGAPRDSRTTVDQGTARTAGDYLGMDGVSNSNHLATIACKLIEIENFGKLISVHADKPTKAEIVERAKSDPQIQASFRFVHRKGAARVSSYSLLGAAHYMLRKKGGPDADVFMDKLIEGVELKARDPIFVAREKLISRDKRLNQNERLKTIIMAWNNYRARSAVKTLTHSVKKGEKLPELR
jgi:hypothetical protein